MERKQPQIKQISIYVPQSAYMEAISPAYRLFNHVNDVMAFSNSGLSFDVQFVGLERDIVAQAGEYTIKTDRLITEVDKTDLIIIPALYGDLARAIEMNKEAIPWVQRMHSQGAEVASLCIGAFLLAATGLLDGKTCSTHWAYYDRFKQMYPQISIVDGAIITDEGNIYSSGGANAIWNLLVYLVEKYTSRDIAILIAKHFLIDIDKNNQKSFTIFSGQKDHRDAEVLSAQEYIEAHFFEKMTINDLAIKINVSHRSFERRFKTATNNTVFEYLQRVRVEAAKRLFETCRKNVGEVMLEVGYTDLQAFRDIFKKTTGLTPVQYKNKYVRV